MYEIPDINVVKYITYITMMYIVVTGNAKKHISTNKITCIESAKLDNHNIDD